MFEARLVPFLTPSPDVPDVRNVGRGHGCEGVREVISVTGIFFRLVFPGREQAEIFVGKTHGRGTLVPFEFSHGLSCLQRWTGMDANCLCGETSVGTPAHFQVFTETQTGGMSGGQVVDMVRNV